MAGVLKREIGETFSKVGETARALTPTSRNVVTTSVKQRDF
jgi:hypothetical protein